jgi:hypothetical protein
MHFLGFPASLTIFISIIMSINTIINSKENKLSYFSYLSETIDGRYELLFE